MDESLSSVKSVRQSQSRGAKASSAQKSNKEASVQREGVKSALRSKENLTAAKDDRNAGGQVSRAPGSTFPDEKKRGRPSRGTRLSGRSSSGESSKGKGANSQHQPSESRTPICADTCSSSTNREATSPLVPATTGRGLAQQDHASTGASAKDKSHVLKAAASMQQPRGEEAEERPAAEEGHLTEQQLGLRQVEERLYRDHIHRLLKPSPEYPNYQYLCKLCSVHIDNIQGAYKHIKEKRHKKNLVEKQEENELLAIPPPSPAQLRALDAAVLDTARLHGISEEDLEARKAVVSRMEAVVTRHLSACSLRLYGSCLTRFAFKTSDINIDVTFPSTMTQPEVLIQVLEILKNSPEFSEVESDFHAKVPAVFCRDRSSGLPCKVSAGNGIACLTTSHLAALAKLEPRLVPLVLAFRCWARMCHIDCQAEGGIPSYSFALMVIFFLQQRKEPILPVYLGHWIEGFDVKRVDEYHLTGIVQETFVKWERRRPSASEGRGENHSEAGGDGTSKPEPSKCDAARPSVGQSRLASGLTKDASLGRLWLELFRFYTLEFALEEYIISIRLKELLSREAKNWPRRRLAIEDPFAFKRNVARSLNSQMVFEYIQECFRAAYKYFACPQRRRRAGGGRGKKRGERMGQQEEKERDDEGGLDLMGDGKRPSSCDSLPDSEDEEENQVPEREAGSHDLLYVFDKMIFTGGKPPTVVCSICKRDGHLKDDCPEDFKKIELNPLPPMNDRFRNILDGLCKLCYYELSPSHVEQQKREQILVGLERFIRKEYNEKAQLCLFGSSKNGFGFRDSDLDICMTLEGHETAEKLNCKEIIEGLAKVLKKHSGLRNILPITTAKVPIVKFEHRQSGLEGDVSLYNTLAQHNTRMLATYAALDPRVQLLGYTIKVFAKRCDIGDASRGSLSSYAYILMVLYFLQQRQPPVIPVLQEIFDGKTVPQRMVDGWNAFFFDDLAELRQRLSNCQPNTESVGELWLGLLRFYTEEFDFKEHVISIRQKKRLTTFEKQWTSKCIAIEDPFDLNHNLGAGVSRKMTNFIMKAFINGRKLFGVPFFPIPGTEVDYFFDSKVLTDGELAPNDRCCRICGKIGHYMKDCPKKHRMKKKDNEKDEDSKEDERDLKERRCFHCGDVGHVRRDCPEYHHLKQRNAGPPAPHMVRAVASSQSIPIPQSAADGPGRTRQLSECSDSLQTPPYSPQPAAVPQSSPLSSGSPQPSHIKTSSVLQKTPPQPQVPLSLFSFPTSHSCQYHPGALTALGLLPSHQSHQSSGQPPHPVHMSSTSWPIHGPVLTSSSATVPSPPGLKFALRSVSGNGSPAGAGGSPGSMNLNDPSIIFAQPAARQLGVGGLGREGLWHNHLAQPGSLVNNGTVVKSESGHQAQLEALSQASRLWEHNKRPQYTLSPSWPYRMPQSFMQQGNGDFQPGKTFVAQGSVLHPNPNFPLVPHVRHPVNLNFIQQKK
ncbi:terminal uridylyltransferase 4 [Nematolebias whitei]|uniref:terminal uridylyltransferase 4 n=1 Tax=Nematolebias whitei TaxID=451745 RepID=UPI00189B20A0|nr:terminal uridylyltransferase 4 [Nematolebias whitei]